ncbi:MAG: DUF4167 domain-containing protein [Novosphingobium sp.]
MNNNRGNNRRRGRGNNRQQGGQQMNRIDSRARGNAPQLLEKYKKLAHDAHLNGDRVQEEYYLQFADHYFRVIADQKQRQEEARQPRRDERPYQGPGEDISLDDDSHSETGHANGNTASERGSRSERDTAGGAPAEEPAKDKTETVAAAEADTSADTSSAAPADDASPEERSIYEPAENPFVRDNRGATRTPKPRKPRRKTRDDDGEAASTGESAKEADAGNLDPATLPPSISAKTSKKAAAPVEAENAEEKPKRRRTRKTAPPADDAGGTLETIDG